MSAARPTGAGFRLAAVTARRWSAHKSGVQGPLAAERSGGIFA